MDTQHKEVECISHTKRKADEAEDPISTNGVKRHKPDPTLEHADNAAAMQARMVYLERMVALLQQVCVKFVYVSITCYRRLHSCAST